MYVYNIYIYIICKLCLTVTLYFVTYLHETLSSK